MERALYVMSKFDILCGFSLDTFFHDTFFYIPRSSAGHTHCMCKTRRQHNKRKKTFGWTLVKKISFIIIYLFVCLFVYLFIYLFTPPPFFFLFLLHYSFAIFLFYF